MKYKSLFGTEEYMYVKNSMSRKQRCALAAGKYITSKN